MCIRFWARFVWYFLEKAEGCWLWVFCVIRKHNSIVYWNVWTAFNLAGLGVVRQCGHDSFSSGCAMFQGVWGDTKSRLSVLFSALCVNKKAQLMGCTVIILMRLWSKGVAECGGRFLCWRGWRSNFYHSYQQSPPECYPRSYQQSLSECSNYEELIQYKWSGKGLKTEETEFAGWFKIR